MRKDVLTLGCRGMALRVILVIVMVVLICCLAAYLVFANAHTQTVTVTDGRLLDQAGIVLAVSLGIAAILLFIVNGWAGEKSTLGSERLRKEFIAWQGELQEIVVMIEGIKKEEIDTCFDQIGMVSEKISDLVRGLNQVLQQLPSEK